MVRSIEIAVGALFVAAAALKGLDLLAFAVQVRYYGVLKDLNLIRYAAVFIIAVETFLGLVLLAGIRLRGATYAAVLGFLATLTALVAYAWAYHDLEDCGCFGKVLPLGPGPTTAKNGLMALTVASAWGLARKKRFSIPSPQSPAVKWGKALASLAGLSAVAFAVFIGDNGAFLDPPLLPGERPFARFSFNTDQGVVNLGHGEYLVAMLSATCDECKAAVGPLNELGRLGDGPRVVGLVLGEEADLKMFRTLTAAEFPLTPIDPLLFFELIGKLPPRFYYVKDGASLVFLDELEPTVEKLLDFLLSAPENP